MIELMLQQMGLQARRLRMRGARLCAEAHQRGAKVKVILENDYLTNGGAGLPSDDFKKKGIETADFAKKLLGQIVFLYFLQKKGWFGVERGAEWGTGNRQFLRYLLEHREQLRARQERSANRPVNFFNDVLEHLFYDGLARECIVLGPGSIDQAHGVEEWVEVAELAKLAKIYARWWGGELKIEN